MSLLDKNAHCINIKNLVLQDNSWKWRHRIVSTLDHEGKYFWCVTSDVNDLQSSRHSYVGCVLNPEQDNQATKHQTQKPWTQSLETKRSRMRKPRKRHLVLTFRLERVLTTPQQSFDLPWLHNYDANIDAQQEYNDLTSSTSTIEVESKSTSALLFSPEAKRGAKLLAKFPTSFSDVRSLHRHCS